MEGRAAPPDPVGRVLGRAGPVEPQVRLGAPSLEAHHRRRAGRKRPCAGRSPRGGARRRAARRPRAEGDSRRGRSDLDGQPVRVLDDGGGALRDDAPGLGTRVRRRPSHRRRGGNGNGGPGEPGRTGLSGEAAARRAEGRGRAESPRPEGSEASGLRRAGSPGGAMRGRTTLPGRNRGRPTCPRTSTLASSMPLRRTSCVRSLFAAESPSP